MFLIFHLFYICISSFTYINDQNRYSVDTDWSNPTYSQGVVSKLCPLGAKYYMYETINTDIYYFLSSGILLEGNLFYLHYVELSNSKQKIIHHVYYKQENQWLSNEFIFNTQDYEGRWFQQYVNYDIEQKLLNFDMRWGNYEKALNQYSFQQFEYKSFNFVIGGSFNVEHPITQTMLYLKTFPGQLRAAISVYQRDMDDAWDIYTETQCSETITLLLGQLEMREFNQHQIYMIENQNLQYYKVTFWAKISKEYDPEIDQKIHILRIVANRFTTDFQATGSNSFILYYVYYSEQKQWMMIIRYYSYALPIIVQFTDNNDPFLKEDVIFIQNYFLLSTWHYIQISYDPYNLNFYLINHKQDEQIEKTYQNVYQFSNIYYRLFFGGSSEELSSLGRSFGLISYYDCNNKNIQCHYSCSTCYGPSQNECLSCPESTNRIYNEVDQTCKCKVWYSETSDFSCQFVTQNEVIVDLVDEQEDQDLEYCKFGEFSFDQMCFQWYYYNQTSPSASQHNQVICVECLMRPIDWVLKSANCKGTYYQFENQSYNSFLKIQNDAKITNIQFIFENEQLIPCHGCLLCNQLEDQDCYLSKYQHLNQQTYIKCYDGYRFANGECSSIKPLKINSIACQNNCLQCKDEQCLKCSSLTQYFINFMGQCQQCSISHCKYCFQYNKYNLKQNSIFINEQSQVNDDYLVGCALCQQGYSFSFKYNLCQKNNIENDCQYYINRDGEIICYATKFELLKNKFQQITNCQDKIPNCEQCIYNLFDLMVCLQCKDGYFNNNLNGLCIACSQKFENVQGCELNNKMLQKYKLETIGYLQQLTQDFYDLSQLFMNYDQVLITQCSNNLVLDINSNKCIDSCSNCDQCEYINGEYQCIKCSSLQDENTDFYSQISGKCYQCPYPCKFCLPLDSDLIHKYNPYFQINSTSIKQTHKCLINFDNNLTYIDQRSGLIKPFNNITQQKQKFISYSQKISTSFQNGNFVLQKSVSNYYYIIQNMIPKQQKALNNYYALQNYTATIIAEVHTTGQGFVELFNITNFHIFNSIYKNKNSYIVVTSLYGVEVIIQNLTLGEEIARNFLTMNFPSNVKIRELLVENLYLSDATIIRINNFVKNASMEMNYLQFKNCTFQDSYFFQFTTDEFNKIFIKSVKIENCTFINSVFISQSLQNHNQQYVIEEFLIEDCLLENSTIFFIPKTQDVIQITKVKLFNIQLHNSTIINTFSSIHLEAIQIADILAIRSIFFYHQFESPSTSFLVNQLKCQSLQLNGSNILQIISLQQNINIDVTIKYSEFLKIDQIYSHGKISDNFIFYIQNANLIAHHLVIQNDLIFQFLSLEDCMKIIIEDLTVEKNKQINESVKSTISSTKIYQNELIYISNFDRLEFKQIKILGMIQIVDPLIQIRSDESGKKYVNITNLVIQNYQSLNLIKSINSVIHIQIYSESIIELRNCIFKSNQFWYQQPNQDLFQSSFIKIKSPKSQIFLNNLIFQDFTVYNSSESIIIIEANSIFAQNLYVQNINVEFQDLIKSLCGFAIFQAEFINFSNSELFDVNSIVYGFIYIQLKQEGKVIIQNCIFDNTIIASQKEYLTQLGGVLTIDAQQSTLKLEISDVKAKNIFTQQKCAFLHLISSTLSNYIFMKNLSFINLYSQENTLGKFDFSSNSNNNKIFLYYITFNNTDEQVLNKLSKYTDSQNSSNLDGIITSSFSPVIIFHFHYAGYLNQPICKLKNGDLRLKQFFLTSIMIISELSHIISVETSLMKNIFIEDFILLNIESQNQLRYFFKLNQTQESQYLRFRNLKLTNIRCPFCQNGLTIFLSDSDHQNILLSNINFVNNDCGNNSCFIVKSKSIKFYKSKFLNNIAQSNGILQFQNSSIKLNQIILKNNFIQNIAGAIYLLNSSIIAIDVIIINNSAKIGGAIFTEQNKLEKNTINQLMLYENKAVDGLNNIKEEADLLKLSMYGVVLKTKRQEMGFLVVDSPEYLVNYKKQRINDTNIKVASGQMLKDFQIFDKSIMQYVKNNISLSIEIYTQLGEKLINNKDRKCYFEQLYVDQEKGYQLQEILISSQQENVTISSFNTETQSYSLDNMLFNLDPYSTQQIYLLVKSYCEGMSEDHIFIFNVTTLKCEIGEYYSNQQCLKCDFDKGYYSVEKDSIECQRLDPKKIKAVTSQSIELLPGFWRYSYYSHYIEQCENNEQCIGGWKVNYDSCKTGSIGAICKECDLYNIRGESSFLKSLQGVCEIREMKPRIIIITLILMLFTFGVTYTISRNKYEMNLLYRSLKLKTKHFKLLFRCQIDQFSTLIRLLIHQMQILYPLLPRISFESNFSQIIWPIGKSSKSLLFLINFVADQFQISIIYLKVIWAILIPIGQILLLGFLYQLCSKLLIDKNKSFRYTLTSCLFLLFYSMPNIMEELSLLTSSRRVVNKEWIETNMAYLFETQQHYFWIFYFILPIMLTLFFTIPLSTFILIRKKHKQIHKIDPTIGIYGFLCNDYKEQFYYWELVNLQMRQIIIVIHTHVNDLRIIFKNLMVILILFIYFVAISLKKPYEKSNINKIEQLSLFLCSIFVCFSSLSYETKVEGLIEVQFIAELIMIIILLFLMIYIFYHIMQTFIKKNDQYFDKLRKVILLKLPKIVYCFPFIRKCLISKAETRKNVMKRFFLIKQHLKIHRLNNSRSLRQTINLNSEDTHVIMSQIQRSDHRHLIMSSYLY